MFIMPQTRKPFIYLALIAVILGMIGIIIMNNAGNFGATGKTVLNDKYSVEEISKHNTKESCWVSYNYEVYDITLFLQIYSEDLSTKCGKDLGSFKQEDASLLSHYKIGELE